MVFLQTSAIDLSLLIQSNEPCVLIDQANAPGVHDNQVRDEAFELNEAGSRRVAELLHGVAGGLRAVAATPAITVARA